MKGKRTGRFYAIAVLAMTAAALILLTVGISALRYLDELTKRELYPLEYQSLVETYCSEYTLPKDIVYAVIRTESSFRSDAVSHAGAKGLMQLTDATYEWIAWRMGEETEPEAVFEPSVNIRYGCYLLNYLYERFGDWETALAAYNAGPNRVAGWLDDPSISENGKLVNIPFEETRNYIKKVFSAREIYRTLYDMNIMDSETK